MDFEEMLRNSTDGQYWTNSSIALTSILMHSTEMWHLSHLHDSYEESFTSVTPFLSENIRTILQVSYCASVLVKLLQLIAGFKMLG
jgi:hypothetical protein